MKTERIDIRVTKEDKAIIFDRAKELGFPVSNYIVYAVKKNKIIHLKDIRSVYNQLIRIGANINQIAQKVNTTNTIYKNEIIQCWDLMEKCFKLIETFVEKNTIENLDANVTINDIYKKVKSIDKKIDSIFKNKS